MQYGAVTEEDQDLGSGAPAFRWSTTTTADLISAVRSQAGMPSNGGCFHWHPTTNGGFWVALHTDTPLTELSDSIKVKLVRTSAGRSHTQP